jgi:hypothetical protein
MTCIDLIIKDRRYLDISMSTPSKCATPTSSFHSCPLDLSKFFAKIGVGHKSLTIMYVLVGNVFFW